MRRVEVTTTAGVLLLGVLSISILLLSGDESAPDPAPSTSGATSSPSGPSAPAADPSAADPSTSAPQVVTAAEAARQAIRRLADDDTGHVRTGLALEGAEVTFDTDYQLSRRAASMRGSVSGADGVLGLRIVTMGPDAWASVTPDSVSGDPTARSCWFRYDPDVLRGLGPAAPRSLRGLPAPVAVARLAQGFERRDDGVIRARSPLPVVAGMVVARTADALGIPADSQARVDVELEVADGRLLAVRADLDDVQAAALAAGHVPQTDAVAEPGAFGGAVMEARFDRPGEPVTISRPAPDRVVPFLADPDRFEAEITSCMRAG